MYADLCYKIDMKQCSKCHQQKDLTEFKIDKRVKSGRQAECYLCGYSRRKNNYEKYRLAEVKRELKTKYNMTLEQYQQKKLAQANKCAICGKNEEQIYRKKLFVDHCHQTGKTRDLLCDKCNKALGHIEDSVEIAYKMTQYLIRHRSRG